MSQMIKDQFDPEVSSDQSSEFNPIPSETNPHRKKIQGILNVVSLIVSSALLFVTFKQYSNSQDLERQINEKTKLTEELQKRISTTAQELPKLSAENNSLKKANAELQDISQSMALQLANKAGMKVIFKE